ncbi:cytochrome P450 4C1-like [Bacillus rossius redtenbacheri]|uniref:cytochrome P450 4C1-like n=1 Tax=Bacillus rossius redtenbacheri TaxID=93214 RepID=UPI002FDD280C
MEPLVLLVGVAVAVTFLFGGHVARLLTQRARLRRQVDRLPGPTAFPVLGTTHHFLLTPRADKLKMYNELIKKYGPVFRLWTTSIPDVILTKPQHYEAIINSPKHLEKSGFYKFMFPWLGTGLVTSSGQKWHSHRKMITPAFHLSILDSFIEVFADNCAILVDKLARRAGGSGFDIFPYITRCALDIICETAMGVAIHAQENADSEYVRTLSDIVELTAHRRERIWLHSDFVFYNTSAGRRYKKCLDILQGFTKEVIQKRKAVLSREMKIDHVSADEDSPCGIKKKAFLDLLIEIASKDGKLSDEEIREEVDTFMFAGHDTTASCVSWTMFMMGHHPEIQEKVFVELSEIFGDSQRRPTMKDLQGMKYLDRVIKETLRLYPAVPMIQRTLGEDVRIDDCVIPAGTNAIIMIYFAHRNPEHFPDPEQFDPDNFLPERVQGRHHFAFIPFSAGPRNCIGKRFALLEVKAMLAFVLRKYKIRSLEGREAVNPMPALVLKPLHGITVALTPRT